MDESIVYNIPGIFIPLKNHYEQEEGAKRLGFEYKDILRLDKLIEEKLSSNLVQEKILRAMEQRKLLRSYQVLFRCYTLIVYENTIGRYNI